MRCFANLLLRCRPSLPSVLTPFLLVDYVRWNVHLLLESSTTSAVRKTHDKFRSCAAQMLRTLLNSASAGTLLLLEDIDAAFSKQRAAAAAGKESQLTFSGILHLHGGSRHALLRSLSETCRHVCAHNLDACFSCYLSGRPRHCCAIVAPCSCHAVYTPVDRVRATKVILMRAGMFETDGTLFATGLLNAIDGVAAQEGRMLFMTTNHIERLNEALVRPGRVDVRLEFTHASAEQITDFFVGFYQAQTQAHQCTACMTI